MLYEVITQVLGYRRFVGCRVAFAQLVENRVIAIDSGGEGAVAVRLRPGPLFPGTATLGVGMLRVARQALKRKRTEMKRAALVVITSYSIHYTKLYERP